MAIQMTSLGGKVALAYDSETNERGIMVKFTNKTGGASVKGTLVSPSPTTDNAVELCASGFDGIGVVQEAGIADASDMWVWVNGSICQVLLKENTGCNREEVALGDDVDGRIYTIAVPSSNPIQAEHFREIGHTLQTVAAPGEGNSALVLCSIHFN